MNNTVSANINNYCVLIPVFAGIFIHQQSAFADCDTFRPALERVAGAQLASETGSLTVKEQHFESCIIVLTGHPDVVKGDWHIEQFHAVEDTALYATGWRMNYQYAADGGQGSQFAIEKQGVFCLFKSQWETGWCCGNNTGVPPEEHWFETRIECADIRR